MRNWDNLMTKLKLKIQLLKNFEIQNSSAIKMIDSDKSYCEKTLQSKQKLSIWLIELRGLI